LVVLSRITNFLQDNMSNVAHSNTQFSNGEAEQNQFNNLFQTYFAVKEWRSRVIIDNKSCNNLASLELVEKLGLTTRPHPRPYYIQ
jgi:hypothetical protein